MDSGYDLSRNYFNWCFENPEIVKPIHTAIFFFAIEHCNRLGGKEKFGFPTQMTMEAIGVKKIQTYTTALKQLVEWGFITMIESSKNQYSANIISLRAVPKKGTARGKALDKAWTKHGAKQGKSTGQSKDTIDKPLNQLTIEPNKPIEPKEINFDPFDENFRIDWLKWVNYKKDEFKQSYKKIETEQIAFDNLVKLSNKNINTAREIINQSIANQWKGLFTLKTDNNGTGTTNNKGFAQKSDAERRKEVGTNFDHL